MLRILQISIILIFIGNITNAQVTQWRGANRNGIFKDSLLAKSWSAEGPELLLEVEGIGKGWSSVVFVDGVYFASGMIDTMDYLSAISSNGEILWQVPYGRSWNKSFPDTRSTPTIEDNRIYVQSGTGRIACINKTDGTEIWALNADEKYEGEYHIWGNSETPLIIDDKVICSPGGKSTSIVALNKMTGELIWKSQSMEGPRGYASATIYEYKNIKYILALLSTHIIALVPETGEIAWSYAYYDSEKWNQSGLIWTNTPTFFEDEIFICMGYDYDAVMLKMDSTGTSVSEKYIDHTFDNHHHGVILLDGYLYGSNWENNRRGKWVCMKWDTGEIKYVQDWENKGNIIMADGMFYCYNEKGSVGLVKPDPDKFEVVSEFQITKGSGPHWAHPFIADGKLIIRHGAIFMVFDIRKQD